MRGTAAKRGIGMVALALMSSGTGVVGIGARPAIASTDAVADPSPTFPPLDDWLPVFDDDFDGTFNGQAIVDAKNTRGAATPDGIDDRVWVGTNFTDPAGISVTATAAGGDPAGVDGGYLNLRSFEDAAGRHSPDWLLTGENEGAHRSLFGATYGYIEARLKMTEPDGANTSFFTYSQDIHGDYAKPLRDPAAAGTEIDIEEEAGQGSDKVHYTVHWDGYNTAHRFEGSGVGSSSIACPGTPCRGNFHTYGVLWDPSGYRFFIDGQEKYFLDKGISHHPTYLQLGEALDGGYAPGPLGDPANPFLLVDYVRIWQPAVSDIGAQAMQRNVAKAVPFSVSSVTSDTATMPGPKVATVDAISSNQAVVRDADLKVAGTGADRVLGMMSRASGGSAGTATITVRAKDSAGTILGSDSFVVTVTDPVASVPTLASGALNDVAVAAGASGALEFATPPSEGSAPTVTVHSSNQYLLPDSSLALGGDQQQRSLAYRLRPTRTGSTDVTVTATDPADSSSTTDTFRINATLSDQLINGGFESGTAPWSLVGGSPMVVSGAAAHSGAQGLHQDMGAIVQHIAVEPATTYAVGAWLRNNGTGSTAFGVPDTNTGASGQQSAIVTSTSTDWEKKEVIFTTGRNTRQVDIVVSNAFISTVGYDVDDVYLVDAPNMTPVPDQSLGHTPCVVPRVWAGRVGEESDPWTLTAAVTAGDASLASIAVVSPNATNGYEKGIKITPVADQTKSGELTVTVTATDIYGRQTSDDFKVWVNAGTFHNGSFEYSPFSSSTSPGCAAIPFAWNKFFAAGAEWARGLEPYDVQSGFTNWGMIVPDQTGGGRDSLFQQVSGLEPNTEYDLSGWIKLNTYPDAGVTSPDGATLSINRWFAGGPSDPLTLISPASGAVSQTTTGWSQRLTVRFRTGADGKAEVRLQGPNHANFTGSYAGWFHDITLTKAT